MAPSALAFVGLGLLGYGLGDSRDRVLVVAVGGCVSCLVTYVAVSRLMPRHYASRLFVVSCALQFLALAAIAALGLQLGPRYHQFEINATDAPIRAVLAMLTVPAGALMAALAWWFVSRLRPPERAAKAEDIAGKRRVYLVIAAFAHLFYWLAGLESSGALGYLGRILAAGLICAPFLAGRDSRVDRRLAALWSFTLLVNAAIGIAAGTRSKALIAVVLFTAGYISAIPKGKRLAVSVCAALAAVPLIQLAGALGVIRDEIGRGGLEMVESAHVTDVFRRLSSEMMPANGQDTEAIREQGVGRLLAWTNVVVPLMTPETIPYRTLDGFLDEVAQTFRVAALSGLTSDDLNDAGLWNAPARQYGFTVNSSTSVEFTLAADGWSRGGGPVALLFSLIAALALTIAEAGAYCLHRRGTGVATILALPIAKAAFFDTNTVPLLPMMRGVILYTLAVAIVVVAVEFTRQRVRSLGRRRGAMRRARWGWHRG